MIYALFALCLIGGFAFGRWYQYEKDNHPQDFVHDYSWSSDESLVEGIKWMMGKPEATLDEVHNWCCDHSKLHMLWEPWRCNKRLLKEIRHWQAEDRRRQSEGIAT